jgi:hypothetical protein
MATVVITLDDNNAPTEHRVQEDVKKVSARVNYAVKAGDPFVALTGEDGKQFTIRAVTVDRVKET